VTNAPVEPAPQRPFVGVDVSKDLLDIARSDAPCPWRQPNTDEGIAALVQTLQDLQPACIVLESTGGLERPLADALLDAGLPVALVNPGNVRHFARGLGLLAKTDRLDAKVLAAFAEKAAPRLLEKRREIQAELDGLVTCRRQLVATRTVQKNRLGATPGKAARKAIQAVLATLEREIDKLDRQIREHIDSDGQWKHVHELIKSAPGAGDVLAATLIAELPELGRASNREIAALAGVAPYNDDSGKKNGRRVIKGGREPVRTTLYMATVSAMTHNPVIRGFASRLEKAGKCWKLTVVACMHKFITLLNTMVREDLQWHELTLVKTLAKNP
jgi:transposase